MSVQKRRDRRRAAGVEHQNADRVSRLAAFAVADRMEDGFLRGDLRSNQS